MGWVGHGVHVPKKGSKQPTKGSEQTETSNKSPSPSPSEYVGQSPDTKVLSPELNRTCAFSLYACVISC